MVSKCSSAIFTKGRALALVKNNPFHFFELYRKIGQLSSKIFAKGADILAPIDGKATRKVSTCSNRKSQKLRVNSWRDLGIGSIKRRFWVGINDEHAIFRCINFEDGLWWYIPTSKLLRFLKSECHDPQFWIICLHSNHVQSHLHCAAITSKLMSYRVDISWSQVYFEGFCWLSRQNPNPPRFFDSLQDGIQVLQSDSTTIQEWVDTYQQFCWLSRSTRCTTVIS